MEKKNKKENENKIESIVHNSDKICLWNSGHSLLSWSRILFSIFASAQNITSLSNSYIC